VEFVEGEFLEVMTIEPFGQVATVDLEYAPDAYSRYLSLLVPEVNWDGAEPEVAIQTLAIVTDQLTSIGGPALVEGALQRYEAIELAGVVEPVPA
jgi:hypothetical protein